MTPNESLRIQIKHWFKDCLDHNIEPVQIFEMLLSESKVLKDDARDSYEKTSEIHDFMLGNLSPTDSDFDDLRTPI